MKFRIQRVRKARRNEMYPFNNFVYPNFIQKNVIPFCIYTKVGYKYPGQAWVNFKQASVIILSKAGFNLLIKMLRRIAGIIQPGKI